MRTLSLLPSATEIMYAIGAADHLVARTHECDYPPEAGSKPSVTSARIDASLASDEIDALVRSQLDETGSLYALDMDTVARLRPQLVLTQQLCTVCAVGYPTVLAAMASLPEPPAVVNLEPRTLEETWGTIAQVGELVGAAERAGECIDDLRRRIRNIPPPAVRPRVLFLEWLIPPFSAGHWMSELVEAAGAIPVLADPGRSSRNLSWHDIGSAEFDTVVVSCCGFGVERTLQDVEASAELASLAAGRPGLRIIVFDGNHFFSRPGPRLVESAELLNHALAGRPASAVNASIPEPYRELTTLHGRTH